MEKHERENDTGWRGYSDLFENIWKFLVLKILPCLENTDSCLIWIISLKVDSFTLTLFRMGDGGGLNVPPTSFPPATSTNGGTRSYLVPVPNYWTWTKTTRQKKRFFWSNPKKIEAMITFLIEMLQLPNFGHITASII